jgi:hypothetical protein
MGLWLDMLISGLPDIFLLWPVCKIDGKGACAGSVSGQELNICRAVVCTDVSQ